VQQYYYTVAALPAVKLEEKPFFDTKTFLVHCAAFLHPRDLAYVKAARISPEDSGQDDDGVVDRGLLAQWNLFFRTVFMNGAVVRAQSLGWEYSARDGLSDPVLAERIRQILGDETPLKSESALMRMMWAFVEEIGTGHYFDREAILTYYLKLQLALRYQRITDTQAGREEFDRQYGELSKALMEIDT